MKNILTLFVCFIVVFFFGCSSGEKRVVIMASGKLAVEGSTIKIEPGFTHNEQDVIFKVDKQTLNVESADGTKKTFELTENGVYLLNLQKDTLIGGVVNYGSSGMPSLITTEQLDRIIDSTNQLMVGKNASDEKKTFFIPPFSLKKISNQNNTRLIGPFKGVPYKVDVDDQGKSPDVIKLFSNKQKRETLNDLMEQRAKIKNMH